MLYLPKLTALTYSSWLMSSVGAALGVLEEAGAMLGVLEEVGAMLRFPEAAGAFSQRASLSIHGSI